MISAVVPGGDPAVVFARVSRCYAETIALDDVSFAIAQGETVALLGPNGAGKSTAVDLMLGLRRPTDGEVRVLGGSPARAATDGRIGAMLQDGGLPTGARVSEVLDLARRLYPRPKPLADLLDMAGLEDLEGRCVDRLSGGQAQRVRLAVALAGNPDVLFLDEPTVGFDVEARRRFWAAVNDAAAHGVTVVFTTHYLDEVDANAGRVLVLAAGRIVADDAPAQIKGRLGERVVHATVAEVCAQQLWELPGVSDVQAHGARVRLTSHDVDATVAALYRCGLEPTGLEISDASLEDALTAITEAADVPTQLVESGR